MTAAVYKNIDINVKLEYMKLFKILFVTLILAGTAIPADAVTEKEMEQARAITAQAYLRYANDGSGYLDEFKASSMQELEGKLKTQEKENIKAFKSVKVPSDYASWDKAKLIEFWSATFFSSPALSDKGKGAKSRVRSRLQAMNVADKPAETPKTAEETSEKPAADTPAAQNPADNNPTAAAAIDEQQQILDDQQQIAADEAAIEETETVKTRRSENTWIYIVALIVLVGVVVALVVFAAKTMKRQPQDAARRRDESVETVDPDDDRMLMKYRKAAEENRHLAEDKAQQIKYLENENSGLRDEISRRDLEIRNLKREREELRNALDEQKRLYEQQIVALQQRLSRPAQALTEPERPLSRQHQAPAAPRLPQQQAARRPLAEEMPKVIYLGRVNPRRIFVRADRRISLGNTIYRLDSADGVVGTFKIVDNPTIQEMVMMDPTMMLASGCQIINPEDIDVAQSVVTENAGTAIFEDGYWKVLRMAKVRFV